MKKPPRELTADLFRDEGLRLFPYHDTVGKLTIGVGRNLSDRGISRSEAEFLLRNDIDLHWRELLQALPWVEHQPVPVQRVVANMAFNMGVGKLLAFKTTLGHIQAGRYTSAAASLLRTKYASQVGDRAERLAALLRSVV